MDLLFYFKEWFNNFDIDRQPKKTPIQAAMIVLKDITVLNTLPNLKEVNLATYSSVDLEGQLDKPERAIYCGRPMVWLSDWQKDDFGI